MHRDQTLTTAFDRTYADRKDVPYYRSPVFLLCCRQASAFSMLNKVFENKCFFTHLLIWCHWNTAIICLVNMENEENLQISTKVWNINGVGLNHWTLAHRSGSRKFRMWLIKHSAQPHVKQYWCPLTRCWVCWVVSAMPSLCLVWQLIPHALFFHM